MKVATRITVATAMVVAIAAATYAMFDLRARGAERRMVLDREARAVANTLRFSLESQAALDVRDARYKAEQLQREIDELEKQAASLPPSGVDVVSPVTSTLSPLRPQLDELTRRLTAARAAAGLTSSLDLALAYRTPGEAQLRELSRATGGWRVTVISRARAQDPVGLPPTQLRRVRTLLDLPQLTFADVEGDSFYASVPVRSTAAGAEQQVVLAMLEISRSTEIGASTEDLVRAIVLVLLIVSVTTVMVGALASRFVSRPITKLLRGIDDVAKGDLSHVILSERDDEIGAIATRFNDMTYSLRESRAETQRQNEATLALEQRLGQTEKLATIGQLAAEIAHEVGTPLNVIAGRARSIQRKSKDPDAVEKNAAIVAEQTARITRIIQRLLDFARRKVGHTERSPVDVGELMVTTIELLAGQFSNAKVRTRFERGASVPKVAGDQDRLQQVLINLLLNAVQAMPEGGLITVELGAAVRTRPGLEGNAEQSFVRLSVEDTGVGIPEGIRDKIFDPFYTTKEGQGGTGLGLAVCFGIVKEHDGWIEVDAAPTAGTVFRIYLPV